MRKLILLLIACASSIWAQNLAGTIVGTVKDTSGAVMPGAKVKLTNEGTGIVAETRTSSSGDFVFTNLPAASFSVQATAEGFQNAIVEHIPLLVGATVRRDFKLAPGNVEQRIVVKADAPVVESETSSISNTVDTHAVANLPIDGRTLDALVSLAPGNATDSASNPRIAGSMYWGGNQFSVDGVNVNSHGNGGATYSYATKLTTLPSIETVQEVKVETNNAKAEHEGSTAVTMISRSGTNSLHGAMYEYNRNRPLTAKDFFSTALDKPQFNRNEYGVNVNGPVVRNRTFFFANYEGLRQRTGRPPSLVVPTEANRNGDFGRSTIKDPLNNNVPFAGSQIPASRIDPRTKQLLAFVPLPNVSDPARNYLTNIVNKFNVDRATGKIDHRLTGRDSISFVWTYANGNPYFYGRGTPSNYGNYSDAGFSTRTQSATWTRTVNANMVNEFRFGRFTSYGYRQGQNLDFDPHKIFPDLFPLPLGGMPNVTVTGLTSLGDVGGSIFKDPASNVSFVDNFTWIRGKHTMKFGYDTVHFYNPGPVSVGAGSLGQFAFNGRWTGNAMADFLLGYLNTSAREMPTAEVALTQWRHSMYVQDDWAIRPNLKLNFGLRYMIQTVMSEENNVWTNFDRATGTLVLRTEGGQLPKAAIARLVAAYPWTSSEKYGWTNGVMRPDHNNFAPRFGFAWRPLRDTKTVLRGGYGIYYSQVPAYIGPLQISRTNPPYSLRETFEPSAGTTPSLTFADPFPSGRGAIAANPNLYAVNPEVRNPLSQQWNMTVERQVIGDLGLRVTYLGNKTTRVPWYGYNWNMPFTQKAGPLQPNRPFQPWGDITALDTNANAFANQLQVQVQRRYASGLYVVAHFTLTKSIDNAANSGSPQNPYNAAAERGNSDGIRQKVFSLTATYPIPFGKTGKVLRTNSALLDAFIGGWNLASLTAVRSGTPFSIAITSNAANGWYATRANVVGDPHVDEPTIERWFNTAAFALPTAYTFGNSGRNILFGPRQVKIDASIYKYFRITERVRMEVRCDAFNMPNHPNFSAPSASVSSPSTFAKVRGTIADTNRAIQFAAKIRF